VKPFFAQNPVWGCISQYNPMMSACPSMDYEFIPSCGNLIGEMMISPQVWDTTFPDNLMNHGHSLGVI
jgi:hypothetical protein